MKSISSHVLDALAGSDAGGIKVSCHRLNADGSRRLLLESKADASGRITIEVNTEDDDEHTRYELVFSCQDYFRSNASGPLAELHSPISDAVFRLDLTGVKDRVHAPIIIAPHGHSTWWSHAGR